MLNFQYFNNTFFLTVLNVDLLTGDMIEQTNMQGLMPTSSTIRTMDQPSFLPFGGASSVRRRDGRTRHFNTAGIER